MIAALYARMLIATLGLLVFATSASAECAWVLWITMSPTRPDTTRAIEAYQTQDQCTRAQLLSEKVLRDRRPSDVETYYQCLPDTVDPRGPEGKVTMTAAHPTTARHSEED